MDYELGGKIVLAGFDFDGSEMVVVKKLVGNYAKKIGNFVEYDEIKLELKSHKKGKAKQFQIKTLIVFNGKTVNSEATGFNLYVLIDETLKKALHEIEHIVRKE